jgi:hypothetical protein
MPCAPRVTHGLQRPGRVATVLQASRPFQPGCGVLPFGRELGREEDSAHGTVGFTIPLINSEIRLNLFQTSKIYSKFISGPKIMKPILLFF